MSTTDDPSLLRSPMSIMSNNSGRYGMAFEDEGEENEFDPLVVGGGVRNNNEESREEFHNTFSNDDMITTDEGDVQRDDTIDEDDSKQEGEEATLDSYAVSESPFIKNQKNKTKTKTKTPIQYHSKRGFIPSCEQSDLLAREYIENGRRTLVKNGYYKALEDSLKLRTHFLVDSNNSNNSDGCTKGKTLFNKGESPPPDGVFLDIIIKQWIEELLRFLAIKSISGDIHVPVVMTPSKQIDEAWKLLMMMPTGYRQVCECMGNQGQVIDYDPLFDSSSSSFLHTSEYARIKTRTQKTAMAYRHCFGGQEPPRLYWSDSTTEAIIKLEEENMRRRRKNNGDGEAQENTYFGVLANKFHDMFRCHEDEEDSDYQRMMLKCHKRKK